MPDPRQVNRDLEQARRRYGGRAWPASFADRLTAPLPGYRDVVKMMRSRPKPDEDALADAGAVPVAPHPGLPGVADGQTAVTWVGHATFVIQVAGMTVLTDPVWSRRIPGVRPRLTPPGIDLDSIRRVDAVLISHNHYDHLDAPTIRRLSRSTPMLVPGGLGRWFRRRGFGQTIELDWWEPVRLGDVEFEFVPSHHWSRRSLADTCRSLWGGWVARTGDTQIYFAGDTGYGPWFAEIGARYPGTDLALLPVGAYEPRWFMRPVHMNPPEAVRACTDLGARLMVTMHWGTFKLSDEPTLAPVREAVAAWEKIGRPREDLWDLAIGESRVL